MSALVKIHERRQGYCQVFGISIPKEEITSAGKLRKTVSDRERKERQPGDRVETAVKQKAADGFGLYGKRI